MATAKKDRKVLNIWIDPDIFKLLKSYSVDSGVPMNKLVEQSILQTLSGSTIEITIKKPVEKAC